MHRLILVDDEQNVLNGIRAVFRLEEYGFSLAGAYTNPLCALEELQETVPDLVITDIKMPQMSGLDFAERVKQRIPDAEIVILSGYEDFEFARTSLRIGAADYLLKPVKKANFEKMLSEMDTRIREKQTQRKQREELAKAVSENCQNMKNRFFLDLIDGSKEDEYYENRRAALDLSLTVDRFFLLKIMLKSAAKDLSLEAFHRSAEDFFPRELRLFGSIEAFRNNEYAYFLLHGLDHEPQGLKDHLSVSVRQFAERYGINCAAAVSRPHTGFQEFFSADMECDAALVYAFMNDAPTATADDGAYAPAGSVLSGTEFENLMIAISLREEQRVRTVIDDLFSPFLDSAAGVDYFYGIAVVILVKLRDLQQSLPEKDRPIADEEIAVKRLKFRCASARALKEFLLGKMYAIMRSGSPAKATTVGKTVSSVMRYVNDHLAADISLSDIADHVHVSRNYLCFIFKKETNSTLLNYIVETRVRRAKDLVKDGRYKMYEIAGMVGYPDYAYFSQIFKKQTGMTLSEYKNTL